MPLGEEGNTGDWDVGGLPTRQLRLALGMRGGVSLAVWIGGACAEIETLRLAGSAVDPQLQDQQAKTGDGPPVTSFYERLLRAAGFDGVQVDVLAGASAGGLNGALLATSLAYGVDFSSFRDVWLKVGGLRRLLERDPGSEPVSIMNGDYFLREMKTRLDRQLDDRDVTRPVAEYIDLHLAATVTTARPVAVTDDEAAWYGEATYRAGFRFRHNRYTSDFLRDPGAEVDEAVAKAVVAKLALAARTSSSFPAAFAPAQILVRRPHEHLGKRAEPGDASDLFGVFSDPSLDTAWVVDGGVLDNIPVARAIQSVGAAPADRLTERWLLYLSPSPEDLVPDDHAKGTTWAETDAAPHLVWTLKAVGRAGGSRESILEDMAALRAHNDLAGRYQAARDLLVGHVTRESSADTIAALAEAAAGGAELFARDRALRSAARVRALLEDPVQALGEDPFPAPMAYPWPLQRGTTQAWSRERRERLERELRSVYGRRLAGVAAARSPAEASALGAYPVLRAARFLISTIGLLERRVDGEAAEQLGALKERLYGLADAAALLAHMGELFWPTYLDANGLAASEPPAADALSEWATSAEEAHRAFLAGAASDTGDVVGRRFAVLCEELRQRLETADPAGSWRQPDDLVAWLWHHLSGQVVSLASTAALPGGINDAEVQDDPDLEAGLLVLQGIAETAASDEATARDQALACLVALEVVTAPLAQIAPLPVQRIRFARLSGANQSPLEWPRLFSPEQTPGERVKAKLNGNELANFAAFYKRSWRANDWMWGRLDAVGTILHVLLRPDDLARRLSATPDGVASLVQAIGEIVTAPFPGPAADSAAWKALFSTLWDGDEDRAGAAVAVQAELETLAQGLGSDLAATHRVLTERRHWELVAAELPCVLAARQADGDEEALYARGIRAWSRRRKARGQSGDGDDEQAYAPATLSQVQQELMDYSIGKETLQDSLGTDHLTRLAVDTARATVAALRHSQKGAPRHLLGILENGVAGLHWVLVNGRLPRRMVGLGGRRKRTEGESR